MEKLLDFIILFLSQFAGGPGPVENNLVRFGLPAVLWAILLYLAWSRQRTQDRPREKLLVWGFGLALVRELYMFGQMAWRLLGIGDVENACDVSQPFEHGLAMAAMIVVAGAFLRYILEDKGIARHYLQTGIGITALVFIFASWTWPRQMAAYPEIKFHQSWSSWLFHVPLSILMGIAVFLLWRKRHWLRNVIVSALTFYLFSELLLLLNYATDRVYNTVTCPISNSLHILAIPLLGYVYLREQSIEKKQAEDALMAYRDHLEVLVSERTAELTMVNASLATQNTVAATLSQSLEIQENLSNVLEMVLAESEMEIGLIFLWDPDNENLLLHLHRGLSSTDEIRALTTDESVCMQVSRQALIGKQTVTANPMDISSAKRNPCTEQADIRSLISVPLVSKGRAVGIMTLGAKHMAAIQPHKLELLTAIGQQIGMAIENAHLYMEAENWAEELTRLHEASSYLTTSFDLDQVTAEIARQSARLLKCQKVGVIRQDEQTQKLELIAGFGFTQDELQVVQSQLPGGDLHLILAGQPKTTAIRDAVTDRRLPDELINKLNMRAALLVPIWSSENPQEFIFLMDVTTVRQWRSQELELIESLANRAAVALVNARLHNQLELAAALEERQRIAANMHDGLAQTLSLLGLRVDRMQDLVEDGSSPEIEASIIEIRDVVANASTEVRRSIASLHEAPRPRRSLQDLLWDLVAQFRAVDQPELQFFPGNIQAQFLLPEQTDQILPVIQEAIMNAHHHSQAQIISIRLESSDGEICITVEDDGTGFDLNAPRHSRDHFGLSIMQARAARIDGKFQIDTSPGNGTRISLAWRPESSEMWKSNILPRKVHKQP